MLRLQLYKPTMYTKTTIPIFIHVYIQNIYSKTLKDSQSLRQYVEQHFHSCH